MKNGDLVAEELIYLYIGLTLLLTVGLRHTNHEDEFHITTFFRVRFAGDHCLVHRSSSFLVIQTSCSVQKLSSLESPSADLFEREGLYSTDCSVIRFIDAQERLLLLYFYTGEASRLW